MYVDLTQSSLDGLKLRHQIQEGRLSTSGPNTAKVTLILEDGRVYSEQGRLQFSDVTVDQSTGSVTVRAVFENKDRVLMPGMFVRARIEQGLNPNALIVPVQGVSHDQKGTPIAMVVDKRNKVAMRPLVTAGTGQNWVFDKGLDPGDRVIVEGIDKVRPGMEVKAAQAQRPRLAHRTHRPRPARKDGRQATWQSSLSIARFSRG